MSKRISPQVKAKTIAMLEAGYSKSATAHQLGISLSTVKRYAEINATRSGAKHDELVEVARESLYSALSHDFAKQQLASLITDNLNHSARFKEEIEGLLDSVSSLPVTNLKEAGAKARVFTAIATAYKLNSDSLRQVMDLAQPKIETEELPTLEIREMWDSEITELRNQQEKEAAAMGL